MRRLHKAAYYDVVTRQFGEWDDEVQGALFTEKWVPEYFEIVELGGEAVGSISARDDPEGVFISELMILPEFQGRGIGGQLLRTEICGADGMRKLIYLQVLQKNDRARAFYERWGFVVNGTTERYFTMSIPRPK
jgi:ribosomal protein S18 acetylase RimI-like enzyme